MVTQHGPEAPRVDSRGASPWLPHFYANTGMYLAAWSRLAALAWSVVASLTFLALAFWPSWNKAAAALLATGFAAALAWLGFFYLANTEWRRGPDGDDA